MSVASLFHEHSLPVFGFLSPGSKAALEAYVSTGNPAFRQKRLLEFFKSLDWLPLEEIPSPLEKLSPSTQQQLYREIRAYLNQKASQREESAERRKAYQLKVFEYYRTHMPSSEKALLESLRDYELDRTGRDVNWQHYFSLKSFKRIDEFIAQSHTERQHQIADFKADVEAYRRNMEKLLHQAACAEEGQLFDFDDWCEWYQAEECASQQKKQQQGQAGAPASHGVLAQAYKFLSLQPGSTLQEVKKRFRELTLQHHPDMPGGNEEQMKHLISAYEAIRHSH